MFAQSLPVVKLQNHDHTHKFSTMTPAAASAACLSPDCTFQEFLRTVHTASLTGLTGSQQVAPLAFLGLITYNIWRNCVQNMAWDKQLFPSVTPTKHHHEERTACQLCPQPIWEVLGQWGGILLWMWRSMFLKS